MKRTGTIIITAIVAAAALFGVLALSADEPPTNGSNPPPGDPQASPTARAPKLAPSAQVQGQGQGMKRQAAHNPGLEQSLAAVDKEAQEIAVALMQEPDPERRAKLERYAAAIEQIRDSLR